MNELCKRYDVDFDTSMSTLKSTRLQPYTEGGRPFGGKCLPKDLDFLNQELRSLGLEEKFLLLKRRQLTLLIAKLPFICYVRDNQKKRSRQHDTEARYHHRQELQHICTDV